MDIGVIGAGVTGLSAAYELCKHGHRVMVFESEELVGGLSSGVRVAGWDWTLDRFYRHVFAGDREIIALARELGVRLRFSRPVTSVWVNGRPYPYDNPKAVALYPRLPLYLNLWAGAVVAYLRYLVRDGRRLESITAHEWLRRAMGRRAYRELWEPLLRGKFKERFERVNMAWFWARVVARTPRLGYFEGGFQAFVDRLAEMVRRWGGELHLSTPVERIVPAGERLSLTTAGDRAWSFDRVLATVSPPTLLRLVPSLPADYARALSALEFTGAVTLVLALDRSVLSDGTYWLNLPAAEFPCLSMVEHTNYQDRAHYGGDVILYLGDYLAPDAPPMRMTASQLYELYRPALLKVRPDFDDRWVRAMWAFRAEYAQPIPAVNHSQRLPGLQTPLAGLYWASMHHVYPWDRGTNYAVELGRRVAVAMDRR